MTATSGRAWLIYALVTVVLWGIWGAFSGLSPQRGFPETLVYCVWALTMIPPALVVLAQAGWKLDRTPRAVAYGLAIGLLGAGGQMLLFYAVARGPAYLIFPVISLSPVVTIALSALLMRERTGRLGAIGIVLALLALPTFDFAPGSAGGSSLTWLVPALIVMLCWGVQAYFMKAANHVTSAESIFVYMTMSGLLLAPVAWAMTDFTAPINWGWDGPGLATVIQSLNAIGALSLVFAFRYGKAILVAPLANAGAPLATALLSLAVLNVVPGPLKMLGIGLALVASLLLALEPDASETQQAETV
ncbi:DMT family transporter [Sphingomonas xinjiangensis]|uniref:Drug/metabolite transporter (DMT)-like permease n=1 Tax=Sphingomonas xinjiangensis TaxID=643568 RepID=A0A840YRX7_9SPHN|nr:DMT family transporter [Sphingomonas xinjiangensis]MBB5712429.1 drug/metabolite transporter (DMT)-like permease [Sphingomonas xinjiangensis]